MKTLYITSGPGNVLVDPENNTANKLNAQRDAISTVYIAEEPMHVVYGAGEYKKNIDVEKDDIIVVFYHKVFKNEILVVKSAEWVENLAIYNKEQQELKERWAAEQKQEACDNTCGSAY